MFINFFFALRKEGVPVTLIEWMTLMEALHIGLAGSSLTQFYHLARSVLVKSETHFDQYDIAFQYFFRGIEPPEKLLKQVTKWIENPLPPYLFSEEERDELIKKLGKPEFEELRAQLQELVEKQDGEHHGGKHWIGTGGTSKFGNAGYSPGGVRIGGASHGRSAVKVAAARNFVDYRSDETLGIRQFEMALRKLRQFSTRLDGPKDELDLEATIEETGRNAGMLKLVWARPRKNTVKLIVLMDIGGSMSAYAQICSQLFSAVHKATHFKDIRFYYFHNCIYDFVYDDDGSYLHRTIKTTDLFNMFDSDYKVILVGDASMAPSELLQQNGIIYWDKDNEEPGLTWLQRVARRFPYNVWLNPIAERHWETSYGAQTINIVRKVFPMYELTLEGIDRAIKKLMVRK
ncbi:MAG: VWA domain-containing protein [Oscillospiraceae bacterium]|nr:VWA domain-containing protein [Oscillospiraceae bacterium]